MAQTAARQGGARARSRHALKDQGKGAAFTSLCGLSRARAREAQTDPHLAPLRRRPLSPIPFSVLGPLVRSAALVTAPVEPGEVRGRRRHDGPNRSTARGRASSLAPRSERSGKRGRVHQSLWPLPRARARGADRPAPGAAAASTAVADSFFRFRTAGAVGGAGDGAGRAGRGTGTSPTRWPKP